MVSAILKSIFCCCNTKEDVSQDLYSESSHLIPETTEPPVIYSNVALVDHQQLHERLGSIVRAKEGKMVNVASHIPFNLHNRVIPPESQHSISRSASGSMDGHFRRYRTNPYTDIRHTTYDFEQTSRASSLAPGHDSGPHSRLGSRPLATEQPKPTPILNVRLVGYTDTRIRGRARERGLQPSGLPSPTLGKDGATHDEWEVSTPVASGPDNEGIHNSVWLLRHLKHKAADNVHSRIELC
ncbi:hypothetical protein B0H34DRAFT_691350 [Crassisporium funariophilum]|nr:hypothetical protein B0H34DRAFT_691350 [Crassisporium funariophilum]